MLKNVIFLDRDGVVNRLLDGGYVMDWKDFEFLPGVFGALRRVKEAGLEVIVVSNQSCIGRGMCSQEVIDGIMDRMTDEILMKGGKIREVYYCPHAPEEICDCRKPEPGLILHAIEEHDVDVSTAWLIGDKPTDVEAARRSGVRSILVLNSVHEGVELEEAKSVATAVVRDISEAVDFALRNAGKVDGFED